MPENFERFAHYTPNGWMLVTLRSILTAPVPAPELARSFALLLVAGALLFALAGCLLDAASRAGGGVMRDAFFVARKICGMRCACRKYGCGCSSCPCYWPISWAP